MSTKSVDSGHPAQSVQDELGQNLGQNLLHSGNQRTSVLESDTVPTELGGLGCHIRNIS